MFLHLIARFLILKQNFRKCELLTVSVLQCKWPSVSCELIKMVYISITHILFSPDPLRQGPIVSNNFLQVPYICWECQSQYPEIRFEIFQANFKFLDSPDPPYILVSVPALLLLLRVLLLFENPSALVFFTHCITSAAHWIFITNPA